MESYRKAHYTLRHRVIASISQRLDGLTYTQRHGLIRGMKRQGGLGFLPAMLAGGDHETAEHAFLRSLDLSDRVVYEIGAFQGILTLFFSSRAREVIAWEPNPPSYARVAQNLRLNGRTNVRVRNFAVGREPGSLTLLSDLFRRPLVEFHAMRRLRPGRAAIMGDPHAAAGNGHADSFR